MNWARRPPPAAQRNAEGRTMTTMVRIINALAAGDGRPLGRKVVKAATTNTQAFGLTTWNRAACPRRSG